MEQESAALTQTAYITLSMIGEYLKWRICPYCGSNDAFFLVSGMLVYTVCQQRIALSWECLQLLFRPRLEDEVTLINWSTAV